MHCKTFELLIGTCIYVRASVCANVQAPFDIFFTFFLLAVDFKF